MTSSIAPTGLVPPLPAVRFLRGLPSVVGVLVVGTLCHVPTAAQSRSARQLVGSLDSPVAVVVDAQSLRVISVGGHAASGPSPLQGTGALMTSICFDNASLSGLSGALPIGTEIVDWGVKSCQGTSYVTRLAIGYSTTALDPSAGGPGASFSFALYEGTTGFGTLGVERARFDLFGLPGIQPGAAALEYALFLDFGNTPLLLNDGNIGCGFMALDGQTGPLLSMAPDPSLGTQDLLDLYIPGPASPASYVTTGPPFRGLNSGSIALQVEQLDPTPLASSSTDPGNGTNPVVLSEAQSAIVGDTWVGVIDLSGFPGATITVIGVSEGAYTPIQTGIGELLVNASSPGFFLDLGFGLHGQPIQPRVDLIGRTFRAQAAIVLAPSGIQLTNALVVTTGF